jgi:hypothetical protein
MALKRLLSKTIKVGSKRSKPEYELEQSLEEGDGEDDISGVEDADDDLPSSNGEFTKAELYQMQLESKRELAEKMKRLK